LSSIRDGTVSHAEDDQESPVADKNLHLMRIEVRVAEEMGGELGGCEILLGALPSRKIWLSAMRDRPTPAASKATRQRRIGLPDLPMDASSSIGLSYGPWLVRHCPCMEQFGRVVSLGGAARVDAVRCRSARITDRASLQLHFHLFDEAGQGKIGPAFDALIFG
jgi:hypothetical protein